MSSECCVSPGAVRVHSIEGHEEKIGSIPIYRTGKSEESLIVIFTDIFGYSFVNTRQIADQLSRETNSTVFVPDYFRGNPMDPTLENLWDLLPSWLKKHPPADASQIAEELLSTVKGHFQTIQLIGFCYGAKVVVHFLTHPELSSMITSSVVAHPSFLVVDEAEKIKRPILFLCAENDSLFTADLRGHFEKVLTENGLGKFLTYPRTTHGFISRPDGSEQIEKQRKKAIDDAIQFFSVYSSKEKK